MNSFSALYPLLIVVGAALLVLILEVFLRRPEKSYLGYISILFLAGCAFVCSQLWMKNISFFGGNLLFDNFALIFVYIFLAATSLVILSSLKYISLQGSNYGEYYALLLFSLSGMIIMVSSLDLLVIFLGLEVLSLSSYALAGLKTESQRSSEAAMKYFLLGSFASALLVFGLALLFGFSRSLEIPKIINQFQSVNNLSLMGTAGLGLVIVGFGFKIALVPFHMWTPDVYQGAPTPISAFFSIGPKAVGFAIFIRIFSLFHPEIQNSEGFFWSLGIIAVLTMLVGNLTALRQSNIKRLLAYSSIAHAGYLLVAVLAGDFSSLIFYLAVYLFMNIGAFSAVIALERKGEEYLDLDDYAGLGFQYPWIGAMMTVFLLSLAGFPPTGGFLAKFYVFASAVEKGLVPLVVIAVIASLISVYYYLRVVVYMYMKQATRPLPIQTDNPGVYLVMFLCLYGVLRLGLFPGNILVWIRQAISFLP
ncbi:MAG: NADH-quinone oxidoreductase subunit N [Acidobacteriota bacterium]